LRSPMYTVVTLIAIGIGVGANTAIFSVINGILLKPLPYPDPERLTGVWQRAPGIGIENMNLSPSDYFTFREENRTFQQFGMWTGGSVSVTGLAAPEQVQDISVTEGTLNALGIQPVLGRWFTPKDDIPGSPETVLVTYGYWQRRLGGDASITGRRIRVDGQSREIIGELGKVLWVLMGSIGVVLLIACANVANLLLVRADGRQHELAIRAALGGSSAQIAGEILIESLCLGVLGGAAGLALAYWSLRLLVTIAPAYLPRLENITIDPLVLLFTLAVSLVAGVLFGLIPVIKYAAPGVTAALRGGGRTLSQSRERHRARNTLAVLQVALAVVLLISSGLMIRTFLALRQVQPGFNGLRELQTVRIFIPEAQVKEPVRVIRMLEDILGKIRAIPGVSSAAFANSVPTDGNNSTDLLYAEDRT